MQVNLGEKMKELRKRDMRRQEDVAHALGVTPQAVSRWEAGICYPDIEMIPSIANYFHITIDELFGYNNDRDKKLEEYQTKAIQLLNEENREDECIKLLRNAISEFPSESILQSILASALYSRGYAEYNGRFEKCNNGVDSYYTSKEGRYTNIYWEEAVIIYEKLLENDNVYIIPLISLYSLVGEYDKAEKVACRQHLLSRSRELMLAHIYNPEKEERYRGVAILSLLHELRNALEDATLRKDELKNSKKGLAILQSVANLYEILIPEGNYGMFHSDMCRLMLSCVGICNQINDYESALDYFDSAFSHYQKYEEGNRMNRNSPTGLLFKDVKPTDLRMLPIIRFGLDPFRCKISELPNDIQEKIKNNPKYASIRVLL